MELLRTPAERGYPAEYLLSRIKGRRSRLIRDWRPLLFGAAPYGQPPSPGTGGAQPQKDADAIWRKLMAEYQWVYAQMNQRLRDIFSPYFLYAELRTIVICLRHCADRKAGSIDELLDRSLLSDELKNVLLLSADLPAAVGGVERLFAPRSARFLGLGAALESGGAREVEQRLVETYLAVTIGSDLHPLMKKFFSRIIDARNIMGLHKYLRLEFKARPAFIPGGAIPGDRLNVLLERDDLPGMAQLVREVSGIAMDKMDSPSIELALYRAITRWLRKEGRDPFGIAPILDYVWRCSIEAMNLSVLHHTGDLEREVVALELVQ